jgi:hypothetical protein
VPHPGSFGSDEKKAVGNGIQCNPILFPLENDAMASSTVSPSGLASDPK